MAATREIAEQLRACVARLDPDAIPLPEIGTLWESFDAIERMAAAAKTLLARRVEDSGEWERRGYRCAAEQLASVAGTSVRAARQLLETSKGVEDLPATRAALRDGELSAAQAEVIVGAATVNPEWEQRLLTAAECRSLADLRHDCLRAKAATGGDATHARICRERRAREFTDAEGAWNLTLRGPAEAGAKIRAAFEPIVDELLRRARRVGNREQREALAFDAFVEMAGRSGGERADETTPTSATRAPRFLALIRIDAEALGRGQVQGHELCEIAGIGPVPVHVARELLGEAICKLVITRGVDVVNVTHLGRGPTAAQRAALLWRNPICTVAGCRGTRVEIDHRIDWARTHRTRLDELDPLCAHHHRLKTRNGWVLVAGAGERPFVAPGDARHPKTPRPPPDP